MVLIETNWVEFQVTGLKTILFLLAWYSQEVGYSIIWYFIAVLEVLIFTFQLLTCSLYSQPHIDSWGSPFGFPSLLPTLLAALVTYILFFHAWWHRPTWRPSLSTGLYVFIFLGVGLYWFLIIPITWIQLVASVLVGGAYASLTSVLLYCVLLPYVIPAIITEFKDTIFINLIGSKNTLLVPR
jgi:hypothetical protein